MKIAMAFWWQLGGLLYLLLLGAMIYAAVAYFRVRGGTWPQVFGWSALVAFVMQAVLMAGDAYEISSPHLTPDLPINFEAWNLVGSVAKFLNGLALLVCGMALIYLGWLEGKAKKGNRGVGKPRRKRA